MLKSELLTFCNDKLIRSDTEAGILTEIQTVLDDLSKMGKWPDLYRADETADRADLVDGTLSSDEPDGLRVLDYIVINDGDNDGRPLREISFKKLLKNRRDGPYYGEPKRFARRGKKVYWDKVPNDDYTAKFYFWLRHPAVKASTDDILFGDEFKNVMKYGVCAEVAKSHKMTGYIDIWEPRYMAEAAKMVPEEDMINTLVEYQD